MTMWPVTEKQNGRVVQIFYIKKFLNAIIHISLLSYFVGRGEGYNQSGLFQFIPHSAEGYARSSIKSAERFT